MSNQKLSQYFFDFKLGNSLEEQSEKIDAHFGVNVRTIEKNLLMTAQKVMPDGNRDSWGRALHEGHQTWVGLHPETLQTSYAEIAEVLKILTPRPDQHFLDLGAGYGRIGLVLHHLFPGCSFTGVEFVKERVVEGNRVFRELNCAHSFLVQKDLAKDDFFLSSADFFFIYDFGNTEEIQKILIQIKTVCGNRPITVVARGPATRHFVHKEHAWLWHIYRPFHGKNYSIYSNFKDQLLHNNLF